MGPAQAAAVYGRSRQNTSNELVFFSKLPAKSCRNQPLERTEPGNEEKLSFSGESTAQRETIVRRKSC